jgi:hypothetical protein
VRPPILVPLAFLSPGLLCLALSGLDPRTASALAAPGPQHEIDTGTPPGAALVLEARKAETDEPLQLARAELLLLAWGDQHVVELPIDGASTELTLDAGWLCEAWPEHCRGVMRAYLFLEAEGRVPLGSKAFRWPGSSPVEPGPVEIAFPRDARVTLTPEGHHRVTVTLRRPETRRLQVVDAAGPIPGVRVTSYRYHGDLNHCGRMTGVLLETGETGDDGRVEVPDGDFEYGFVFDKPHHVLRDPEAPEYPNRLITRLDRPETRVELRELVQRPLRLVVTDGGRPASSLALHGCRSGCPGGVCAACCGALAETDEAGVVEIDDFRPEAWAKVYLVDAKGNRLWEAVPSHWEEQLDGPIRVELAATPGAQ